MFLFHSSPQLLTNGMCTPVGPHMFVRIQSGDKPHNNWDRKFNAIDSPLTGTQAAGKIFAGCLKVLVA